MTQEKQIYKCEVCGNIVEVIQAGGGELVCCGKAMTLQKENTGDAAQEKHIPVIEKTDSGYVVAVGSSLHPMTEDHFIEWIELIADNKIYRKQLKPGDSPVAEFNIKAKDIKVRSYCNLHGLWLTNI